MPRTPAPMRPGSTTPRRILTHGLGCYSAGCTCPVGRAANAAKSRAYRARLARAGRNTRGQRIY